MSRSNGTTDGPLEPDIPPKTSSSSPDPTVELAWLKPYVSPPTFTFITQNLGLSLVASAQFFFASMNITVKYFLSITNISVSTLILVRMGITSLGCILALYLVYRDPNPILGPPEARRLLVMRGVAGMVGLFAAYKSYEGLSVTDATSIIFLAPPLGTLLGWVFLRERCSVREILAGGMCLVGVGLVSRPPFIFGHWDDGDDLPPVEGGPGEVGQTTSRMEGVAWALLGVVGAASAYLLVRMIGHKAHALHTIGVFAHMCTGSTIIISLFTAKDAVWVESGYQLFLICLIGVFGFFAQMLLTLGLQRERVGRAGIALYLSVFFAIILEIIFFHTFPAFLSLIGISIILGSAYWVAQTKQKPSSKEGLGRDLETQPISPSPTPSHSPALRTVRSNSYMSVHRPDLNEEEDTAESDGLLRAHPYPQLGRERSPSGSSTR